MACYPQCGGNRIWDRHHLIESGRCYVASSVLIGGEDDDIFHSWQITPKDDGRPLRVVVDVVRPRMVGIDVLLTNSLRVYHCAAPQITGFKSLYIESGNDAKVSP